MAETDSHQPLQSYPHEHGAGCGHAALQHRDHVDYLHDGHAHRIHGDHVDDEPVIGSEAHVAHPGHMHVHREGCGHQAVRHEDHVDYIHGAHRHTGHQVHYDEH